MKNLSKIPAYLGAIILILVSGFHLTGLGMAKETASTTENPFMKAALEPIWAMPSVHWLVFAVIVVVMNRKPSRHTRMIILLIAVAVIVDAVLIGMKLGPFIGAILLAVSGILIAGSALKTA